MLILFANSNDSELKTVIMDAFNNLAALALDYSCWLVTVLMVTANVPCVRGSKSVSGSLLRNCSVFVCFNIITLTPCIIIQCYSKLFHTDCTAKLKLLSLYNQWLYTRNAPPWSISSIKSLTSHLIEESFGNSLFHWPEQPVISSLVWAIFPPQWMVAFERLLRAVEQDGRKDP